MIADAGLTVRQAIRDKGTPYAELGLDNPECTDDQLLDAMLKDPILINRPFVITPLGTRLARPSELVLEILPETPLAKKTARRFWTARESGLSDQPLMQGEAVLLAGRGGRRKDETQKPAQRAIIKSP